MGARPILGKPLSDVHVDFPIPAPQHLHIKVKKQKYGDDLMFYPSGSLPALAVGLLGGVPEVEREGSACRVGVRFLFAAFSQLPLELLGGNTQESLEKTLPGQKGLEVPEAAWMKSRGWSSGAQQLLDGSTDRSLLPLELQGRGKGKWSSGSIAGNNGRDPPDRAGEREPLGLQGNLGEDEHGNVGRQRRWSCWGCARGAFPGE